MNNPPVAPASDGPASMIVMGGSDAVNKDYSALKKVAKGGKPIDRWSCLKDTRRGDEMWFYITSPNSAIVAVGRAASDAQPGKNWPYECKAGKIQWIEEPITRHELVDMFPDWDWPRYTRGKVRLTDERAGAATKSSCRCC